MPSGRSCISLRVPALVLVCLSAVSIVQGQGARQTESGASISDPDTNHIRERNEWFFRGRIVPGKPSAELRRRAYQGKLRLRAQRAAALASPNGPVSLSLGTWVPLGPVPLASDATGNGTQDYHQVSGRATAVAIDPADPSGNTVYIGGAQSGVWKSTNGANGSTNDVAWTAMSDDAATLSIGAIAIQPGNSDPAKTVILAATGEANNAGDSYFGLGILRSADAGNTWTLISSANGGSLSFSGLGGTRMAFSTASGHMSTVVAAMATTSEGLVDGAVTSNTTRGLYTSLNAGQSWSYDALADPGGAADATSATSVVYNTSAGLFFAAVRYHGIYSSPDGVTWTRLSAQPGGALLSAAACPPQSTSNNYGCPLYRGEITVVPGRNEMYVWFLSLSSTGSVVDGGIWQSVNGGASWNSISDSGITNCGDFEGCGVEQGSYNLELLAMPNASGTDLYAGAINLYKCAVNSQNPSCTSSPFMNLTHVYGCDPIGAPAHVHPAEHALAYVIPGTGSDSGNALMYFANDGGIYRALNGFLGLNTGSCSGTNQFDDLNQNLGSMTQFVSFSQHPTDPQTLLGGAQDNGSPATNQAMVTLGWLNVLGGDGGYSAIDPTPPYHFYSSNPDVPPGGLGVQVCSNGANCNNGSFSFVVTSSDIGGDDGGFYFPYILDPRSYTALLVGTCRVWRGPRSGGAYAVLSPNFDTLSAGICSGSEVNQVRALAAGGPTDNYGSEVIYATTSGLGPVDGPLSTPAGGRVWVTTNATAGASYFSDVTNNGLQGNINPNQFPVSSVAIDPADSTAATAYVTVMGFTGGSGHVWKTTNAGASWTDFTANLPDAPVNVVVVDPMQPQVYVGTDVGVFASSTTSASWIELGPNPNTNQNGFLPDVAVTALAIFDSGGQDLLRASTYGRGIWQFNLVITPDFQLSVSNSPLTIFSGQTAQVSGTVSAVNGYTSSVVLSCVAGTTAPPSTCTPSPSTLTPGNKTPFMVTVGGAVGDYSFNIQALGSDSKHITHTIPVTIHMVGFGLTTPVPSSVTVARGATSSPVNFQVTAAGSFNQSVTVSCAVNIPSSTCTLTPGNTVSPTSTSPVNMTASVAVPAGATGGNYLVNIQATTAGVSAALTASFTLVVTSNPDFTLTEPSAFPEVNAGSSSTTGPIAISSQDGFSGTVTLSCSITAGSCSLNPTSVSSFPATSTLAINGTALEAGNYSLLVSGASGSTTHSISIPFNVGDYSISGTQTLFLAPGGHGTTNLTLTASTLYGGQINATCDASALVGATCTVSPTNPVPVASGGTVNLTANINVPNSAATGSYAIQVKTQDTTGAPSHAFSVSLTVGQDFRLSSSTPSQTVNAGQSSGPYNLTIQPVGTSFNGAVTFTCANLPSLALCSFNPAAPVTPGNSAVNVVMTISTTATTSALRARRSSFYAAWLVLPGLAICWVGLGRRSAKSKLAPLTGSTILFLLVLVFTACGGVSSGGGGGGKQGTPPGTYKITVTGASSGTPADSGQTTQVTLVVN